MPSDWVGRQVRPAAQGGIADAPHASPRAEGRLHVPMPNPTQTSVELLPQSFVGWPCDKHGSPSPGGLRQVSELVSQVRSMLVSHRSF